MGLVWPAMTVGVEGSWFVTWEGPISTLMRTYEVRIQYVRPTHLKNGMFLYGGMPNPSVWVIDPPLKIRCDSKRLPHTFHNPDRPPNQAWLCLFFLGDDDWTPADYVADKIVPWAAEWLTFYEGWLVTGEWHGGGLHPGDEDWRSWESANRAEIGQSVVQPGPYRRSADNYVGRRTGTSASFPLMEAASRASSRRVCWPDWSNVRWAAPPSPATST
jgi:hypothetical protein